ncbi:DNA polymerase III subunit delta [Pelagibacterales bacterium SAG-MED39]|nr:DNA polymerase III subunit delta [Pelagibacterales bacterium SAG-MED39]
MIIKNFELNKANFKDFNFFLFYGVNDGHKEEVIKMIINIKKIEKTTYFESEILSNTENFLNSIISKSFFESEKLIVVNKVTDKFKCIIDEILDKKIKDLIVILNSDELNKKSKLRNIFEKEKNLVCTPFYEDNYQTLSSLTSNFFKEIKISVSREIINLVVERSNGSRQHLNNEIFKIKNYLLDKDKLSLNEVQKLTNLSENYNISELVDNCLAKNKNKIFKIMNENNFSNDETIMIIRTFLSKTKRLYLIKKEQKKGLNLEKAILNFRPPIFWKDKDIVKQQLKLWSYDNIQKLIFEISQTEFNIKKNISNSINILQDFIYTQSRIINN